MTKSSPSIVLGSSLIRHPPPPGPHRFAIRRPLVRIDPPSTALGCPHPLLPFGAAQNIYGEACDDSAHSNFRSYSSAAIRTTKQDPALCTSAPVVGVSSPSTERVTATKLMHMDSVMLVRIVFTVAFERRFR